MNQPESREIKILIKKTKIFNEHELRELFLSVNWNSANIPEILVSAFSNAAHVVSAWEDNKLIGIIRSMDDGCWSANIDCLIVHKDYQRMGVGKTILHELLDDIKDVE